MAQPAATGAPPPEKGAPTVDDVVVKPFSTMASDTAAFAVLVPPGAAAVSVNEGEGPTLIG